MNPDDDTEWGITEIPKRANGNPRAFWYDPRFPRHIMHFRGDHVHTICIGHSHG